MTITDQPRVSDSDIATERDTSRAWWFLGTLAVLRNPESAPRTPAVIELTVPPGGSPPRHVHDSLDDSFLLLDGEVVVRCGDATVVARPDTYVVLPHGVEHTFRVTSPTPARLLLVHADDSFLRLIEAIGTPTNDLRLPPPSTPTPDGDALGQMLSEHRSPAVGPPLDEDDALAFVADRSAEDGLGAVNHIALHVSDVARSEEWYSRAFGLLRVDGEIAPDGTGHLVLLSPDNGLLITLASASVPKVEHIAVTCSDRDALVRWHERLGQRDVSPGSVTDAPYGSGFVLRDPDGLEIELFTPASSTP